jgi:hypothetical protein
MIKPEETRNSVTSTPKSPRFIHDLYTVAQTVCFTFSREFADGEIGVAYYRLEIIQRFGTQGYCAMLRETDRAGNIVARRGDFSHATWPNTEAVISDVLTWCNSQVWPHGQWAAD